MGFFDKLKSGAKSVRGKISSGAKGLGNAYGAWKEERDAQRTDICDVCSGSGKCPVCNGEGKLELGTKCPKCRGSGKCPVCNGSGTKKIAGSGWWKLGHGEGGFSIGDLAKKFGLPGIIIILGVFLSAFSFYILIACVLIAIFWIIVAMSGPQSKLRAAVSVAFRWIVLLIIIGLIIWGVWFLSFTKTGERILTQTGMSKAGIFEVFRDVAPQINIFKAVITGQMDYTQLWTSKTYEDKYAVVKDVGIRVEDLKPLRPFFYEGDEIAIIARIRAASLPDSKTIIQNIDINDEALDLSSTACEWECSPPAIKEEQIFIGQVVCSCTAPQPNGESEARTAKFHYDYDFNAVAGKQIYVAKYNELNNLYINSIEPLSYYGIESDQLASWQTSGPVGIGMGLTGEETIISANYNDGTDKYEAPYYLGITITNNGVGELEISTNTKLFNITLPCNVDVDIDASDNDFELLSEKEDFGNIEDYLCVYNPKNSNYARGSIAPGEYKTLYLKFRVWDGVNKDFMEGQALSSFFVKADLAYTYNDASFVAYEIRKSATS